MTKQEVDYFEPLLGMKISSITLDDELGIVDIGLQDDVHLKLTADIQPKEVILNGSVTVRITGEIVNVLY